MPELEIAVHLSLDSNMSPLDWLQDVWNCMAKLVVNNVSAEGKKAEQNDVGDLSMAEAKRALVACNADIEAATQLCLEERRKKVGFIMIFVSWHNS